MLHHVSLTPRLQGGTKVFWSDLDVRLHDLALGRLSLHKVLVARGGGADGGPHTGDDDAGSLAVGLNDGLARAVHDRADAVASRTHQVLAMLDRA